MPSPFTQNVFAYGTLLDIATRNEVFGRRVPGVRASLTGWKKKYDDEGFPYLERATGLAPSKVSGLLLELTTADLAKLDAWETKYHRIKVKLDDGTAAWAYEEAGH